MLERRFRPPHPVDLRLTLGPLCRGRGDLTMRFDGTGVWRATRTPDGPATMHLSSHGDELTARAWGPGAPWALESAPALVGALDDDRSFEPRHPVLVDLHHRLRGLRIPRSGAVVEALVPTIIEQKVTTVEAKRSYRDLVAALGEPAPGPAGGPGLRLPPTPGRLAATPSYAMHRFGLERKRADTVRRACAVARRLEETTAMSPVDARRRLSVVPGLGPWTAAQVAVVALGDADAVSLGDYNFPRLVSWALAGEGRGDDARMLELLEPYRGHRGRVIRLIVAAGLGPPRIAPRARLRSIARI
ncbi:MAG TPA: hypothetical protein VNA57_13700 [Acidimicrobiales bacterium]|nr:hypothetical protein [Acidimicrobiales bacterium]